MSLVFNGEILFPKLPKIPVELFLVEFFQAIVLLKCIKDSNKLGIVLEIHSIKGVKPVFSPKIQKNLFDIAIEDGEKVWLMMTAILAGKRIKPMILAIDCN